MSIKLNFAVTVQSWFMLFKSWKFTPEIEYAYPFKSPTALIPSIPTTPPIIIFYQTTYTIEVDTKLKKIMILASKINHQNCSLSNNKQRVSSTSWGMLKDLSHLIFPFKVWPFFNFIYLFNLSICLSVLLFILAFLLLSAWRNWCSCKKIHTFTFTPMYFSTLPSKSTSWGPSSSRSSSPCSPSYGNKTKIYTKSFQDQLDLKKKTRHVFQKDT